MPKLKTNRSAAKRFRFTKRGKIKKKSAKRGHLLRKKGSRRMRQLKQAGYVSSVDEARIRKLLPYG